MRALLLSLIALTLTARDVTVQSPNGKLRVTLAPSGSTLSYRATLDGKPLIGESPLGLDGITADWSGVKVRTRQVSSSWKPVYGERDVIPDHFRETTLSTATLSVVVRAYNEGFAIRYRVEGAGAVGFAGEKTGFRLPDGAVAWSEYGTEGEYAPVPVAQVKDKCERPLTIDLRDGRFVAIAEAAVVDYPRMLLAPDGTGGLRAQLDSAEAGQAPLETPWRVFVIGRRPGDLLEHDYLLLNLNAPQALTDVSWIKPGKVIREVTLSTSGGKRAVDFAVKHGLQYVEYDAGWYGYEYDDASDARRVSLDQKRVGGIPNHDGLDLPAVIAYARARGIGIILYVNRRALEKQLDELLPLYKSWGVAGLKFGFVNVGPQEWSSWLHTAIRKAAEHHLMVDVHDGYRPTGYTRTYPNLMTVEGVRGNEHMPTARHNTTLPFTRAIAGAYDYTICWTTTRLKTTRPHQMAQSVIHYSPWQFLFWYDKPDEIQPDPALDFFRDLPTVWDETRALQGEIGELAVVARRKGAEWWIGAITNEQARAVSLPLRFLKYGGGRQATVYCDSGTQQLQVDRSTTLELNLAANGGCALRISAAR
ncbi:MAG TPA: glycoside hydrolase family 97 catalytic domain-containing protein [Paludibaculum sp.]|jgi:alpha-glucosidase